MQVSKKQEVFAHFFLFINFFFAFSKFAFNFEHFQKKLTLVVDAFLNLRTPKDVVRKMSKKSNFRGPFEK